MKKRGKNVIKEEYFLCKIIFSSCNLFNGASSLLTFSLLTLVYIFSQMIFVFLSG